MGFSEDLNRVHEITELLSDDTLDLDKSIKLYEEGTEILKRLNRSLNEAKRKVELATGSVEDGVETLECEQTDDGEALL